MRQEIPTIEYTITSRGRPIGTTTFGFVRISDVRRAGWFFPNDQAAGAMEIVRAFLRATMAVSPGPIRDDESASSREAWMKSAEWADYVEAGHHVDKLDLEVRRADGSIVPTEWVGIQDTNLLLALTAEDRERQEQWTDDECLNWDPANALLADVESEVEDYDEELFDIDDCIAPGDWVPDEAMEFPQYQICAEFTVPGAVP